MILSFLRKFVKAMLFPNIRGYSIRGFWGEIKHFNKYGVQIGYSVKTFGGGRKRYDMDGNLISYSVRNFWGGYDTYDAQGNLIKKSYRNFWGGYTTYNRDGKKISESYKSFWGGMNHFDVDDSGSTETYIFEKRTRTKGVQNTSSKSVSDKSARRNSTQNYSVSGVKTKREKVQTTRSQVRESKEDKKDTSLQLEFTDNRDTRYARGESSVRTTEHIENRCTEKAELNKLFQQRIDKSIPFCESLTELNDEQNEYGEGVKILAFAYNDLKEFPAYVQSIGDKLSISPLIRNVQSFTIDKAEIYEARKETVEGLEMDVVDNEFASFCTSKIVNDFGNLFPEYEYKNDGMARVQYEFKCGLIITENSWVNMKEAFCLETKEY